MAEGVGVQLLGRGFNGWGFKDLGLGTHLGLNGLD